MRISEPVLFLACVMLLAGCMPRLPHHGPLPPGDLLGFFIQPSSARKGRYVLHVPEKLRPPFSLVVALHGVANTSATMAAKTGLNSLAERHGFLVLYPEGMGLFGAWQHWNAGFCCGLAHEQGVDDVAFVRRCIQDLEKRLRHGLYRVYMLGHSNGGMLTYAYAARHPDELQAIAVVAGTAGGSAGPGTSFGQVQPQGVPVPLLVIHGQEDQAVPPRGGASSDPFLAAYGERLSLQESLDIWLEHNHCTGAPLEREEYAGRVLRQDWCAGLPRRAVRLLLLRNWPHAWPGPGAGQVPGHSLPPGFSAAEAIWEFFTSLEPTKVGQTGSLQCPWSEPHGNGIVNAPRCLSVAHHRDPHANDGLDF